MSIPSITEADIREHTAGGSFERGEHYFKERAVRKVDVHSDEIEAYVKGSAPNPYVVTVQFDQQGIEKTRCTCPYHEGSWCKHIVAALLAYVREGGEREQTLQARLEDRSREELVSLVKRLADRDARVQEWVEDEVS